MKLPIGLLTFFALAATVALPSAQAQSTEPTGHIAVLLPIKSDTLGRQADAVRQGVDAAAAQDPQGVRIIVHATSDDAKDIQATYDRAIAQGARAVIGPLSRTAVTSLARNGKVQVPTLALNAPEGELVMPRNLFVFGLQVDGEARQLAKMAANKGLKRAFIVSADTPVSSRIVHAFKDEWMARGGHIAEDFPYVSDTALLSKLRDKPQAAQADFVLLALDSVRAKLARPYLAGTLGIFATSLAYSGNDPLENFELEGVTFLDMPWLLQRDHSAVAVYSSPSTLTTLESQRFFALGIDAYRIAQELLKPTMKIDDEPLDGVTGLVTRGENQRFVRELTPAEFRHGIARAIGDNAYR